MTGNEEDLDDLLARLRRVADALAGEDHLQEVRLDLLVGPGKEAVEALRPFAAHLLVTCRPERQGGGFGGSEDERLAILDTAARLAPAWMDVEADCPLPVPARLRERGARGVLASWHVFRWDPDTLADDLKRLVSVPADAHKLAVQVEDAAHLRVLRERAASQPSVLTIGMGEAGRLSRCRYRHFGNRWTYVSADGERATAPGQLSLSEARALGLPEAAAHPFFCLVGGPQVRHSPGPVAYNRLFRARDLPWSYVAVPSADGQEALTLVEELGARGVSVTMPHKACALRMGEPDEVARRVGAANTLRFGPGSRGATNTDVAGVREPLGRVLAELPPPPVEGPRAALVLGAGGAARAAVQACVDLGLSVSVSARRVDAARAIGSAARPVPWERRADEAAHVLINATPVAGADLPWPAGRPLVKEIVFDLALSDRPSALLALAQAEGARTLEALEMWLAQGAAQLAYMAGETVSPEELRQALS